MAHISVMVSVLSVRFRRGSVVVDNTPDHQSRCHKFDSSICQ